MEYEHEMTDSELLLSCKTILELPEILLTSAKEELQHSLQTEKTNDVQWESVRTFTHMFCVVNKALAFLFWTWSYGEGEQPRLWEHTNLKVMVHLPCHLFQLAHLL